MYDVIDTIMGVNGMMYKIINDYGIISHYLIIRFLDVKEHRDKQINSILND